MTVITAAVNLWPVEKKERRRQREKDREGEVGNSNAKFMNPGCCLLNLKTHHTGSVRSEDLMGCLHPQLSLKK